MQFCCRSAAKAAQKLEELSRSGTVAGGDVLLTTLRREIVLLMKSLHSMVSHLEKNRAQ